MDQNLKHVTTMADLIFVTYSMVIALLNKAGIPYELRESEMNSRGRVSEPYIPNGRPSLFYILHIDFPWTPKQADVAIGTLHCMDDELMFSDTGTVYGHRYPSIETYNFPWDMGDISVFATPEEFVNKVQEYYLQITGGEENE